ncbi:DUF1816 domain-containing protein [Gloeobacter kilaueensis]|uniref:SPOR domain-containing protein n=1 Tax=Gloeobacter kilaueensis (strain ATCC BAA-2537 / CCAP 1431/1 / ULC 316 / JS1) TaxID=1183438 RepID=U5QRU5_GLOK1|nr:DUF1816 domain-containing protein [Gloeobacter kilaueensis]AGY60334.1 hypothetical protein GKIL_4088 [Gloeobacter kilaueensis JS1]
MHRTPLSQTTAAWWLELATDEPYLYLFGPFETAAEADAATARHRQDLLAEGWQITSTRVTLQGPSGEVLVA